MSIEQLMELLPERAQVYRAAGGGWIVRVPPPGVRSGFYHHRRFENPDLCRALTAAVRWYERAEAELTTETIQ